MALPAERGADRWQATQRAPVGYPGAVRPVVDVVAGLQGDLGDQSCEAPLLFVVLEGEGDVLQISRVHGRPKETVENVTAFDDPLDVSKMTREQRDALKRELVRQHPELAERILGIRAVE